MGVGVLSGVSFCYWEVGMVMVFYGGFVWRVIMEYVYNKVWIWRLGWRKKGYGLFGLCLFLFWLRPFNCFIVHFLYLITTVR